MDHRIEFERGDITEFDVDVIVNAANPQLAPGGGVCGAIHHAAGPNLAKECERLGGCLTGESCITGGYLLRAGHVIHTVGPVWRGGRHGEAEQLAGCYRESLRVSVENGLRTIAFPLISAGVYGYPIDEAITIALSEIDSFLTRDTVLERVILIAYDRPTLRCIESIAAVL
ncbi:macro domain-containing protein [bacterium]|nr:macro domain-containing protein [bacterium]